MKILKIQFKNIHSLQGEHEIDFTQKPFSTNQLFVITGSTGSGKSTILDVISLALFNRIPRSETIISKNSIQAHGSILTRGQKNAEAMVTYQCKKGTFQSVWRISTDQKLKLKDYEMELFDLHSKQLIVEKKSEVPTKNEDIIGLNYDQFIKSVMLAQGAFAEFLKASKSQRAELLEKITGTNIYRSLGQKAFEKYREFDNKIKFLSEQKLREEQKIQSPNIVAELSLKIKNIDENINQTEKEIQEISQCISTTQQIEQEQKNLSVYEKNLENTQLKLTHFKNNNGIKLALHENIASMGDQLKQWEQIQSKLEEDKKILLENEKNIATLSENKEKLHKNIETITQKKFPFEKYDTHLSTFEKHIRDLHNKRKELIENFTNISNEIKNTLRSIGIDTLNIENDQYEKKILSETEILENITKTISEKERENNFYNQNIENIINAQNQSKNIAQQKENLNKITSELNSIEKKLSPLDKKIETAYKQTELTKNNLKIKQLEKENQLIYASFEKHRNLLEQGKPCPLCGALHHPYSQQKKQTYIDVLEQEISKLENQKIYSENQYNLLITQKQSLNAEKKIKITDKQHIQNTLEQSIKNFKNLFTLDLYSDWAYIINEHKQYHEFLKEKENCQEKLKVLNSLEDKIKKYRDILHEGKLIKKQIDALSQLPLNKIEENIQEYKKSCQNIVIETEKLQTIREVAQNNISKFSEENKTLTHHLKQHLPSDNINLHLKQLLPYNEVQTLKAEQKSITDDIQKYSTLIQTQKKRLEQLLINKQEPLEKLKQQKQQLEQNLKELKNTREDNKLILSQQKLTIQSVEQFRKDIFETQQKSHIWKIMKEIIGDAKGDRFNKFAQDLTLMQLLSLANKRLKKLNPRYLLVKNDDNKNQDLAVIDQLLGGYQRSVETLSGGETFIVSLALALALSDLVSENVKIYHLFIDEGFGTLDAETLDQTIDVLERLQENDSKMIGIISHIEAIKERIPTQIQVVKNAGGYSSIRIAN